MTHIVVDADAAGLGGRGGLCGPQQPVEKIVQQCRALLAEHPHLSLTRNHEREPNCWCIQYSHRDMQKVEIDSNSAAGGEGPIVRGNRNDGMGGRVRSATDQVDTVRSGERVQPVVVPVGSTYQ